MKKGSSIILALAFALAAVLLPGCTQQGAEADPGVQEPVGAPDQELPGAWEEAGEPLEEEAQEEPPAYEWELDTPENHGMDAGVLEELHQALAAEDIYSMITVRSGFLVDEYYKEGYDATSVFRLNSCSKSFTSALIGIAIDEGLIDGVDVSIAQYYPQLVGTDKEEITIRHLLEHTSGIEWYEWNSGSTFREWRDRDDWVDYVLEQPVVTQPGSTFNYSTGGPHLLAAILQEATGMSAADYAWERLFLPMGMLSVEWSADPQGVTDGGNGISMTARDAAKFGQLFLDGGRWDGQQLIPEEWVEESTRQQSAGIGSSGVYGYQWWIQSFGDRNYHTYYAMGHAGQYILVVPEMDLVTVATSSMSMGTYEARDHFSNYLLAACG